MTTTKLLEVECQYPITGERSPISELTRLNVE